MRARRAFTLVELLVVVSIIMILIALLLPALGKARKYAQEVQCAANLRTQGHALMAYVSQSGYYPGCIGMGGLNSFGAIWPTRLRAFLGGDRRPFNCPAQDEQTWWTDRGPGGGSLNVANEVFAAWFGYEVGEPIITPTDPNAGAPGVAAPSSYFTYGYNMWGTADSYSAPYRDSHMRGLGAYISVFPAPRSGIYPGYVTTYRQCEIPASWVVRPAEMIAIADSSVDGVWDFTIDAYHEPGLPPMNWPGTIHRGGANVLFCDGHVAWYVQKDLVDFSGPLGESRRRMWHSDHEP